MTSQRSSLTVGRALVRRRDELSISRDAAAESVGVSRSTYSAYEGDRRRLSPEALRTLAVFLNVGLEEILELYGETCVIQARRVLLGGSPVGTAGDSRTGIRRTARNNDMAIVERVYFEGSSRDDAREDVEPQTPNALPSESSDSVAEVPLHSGDSTTAERELDGKDETHGAEKNPVGTEATSSVSENGSMVATSKKAKAKKAKSMKAKSKKAKTKKAKSVKSASAKAR